VIAVRATGTKAIAMRIMAGTPRMRTAMNRAILGCSTEIRTLRERPMLDSWIVTPKRYER